jgi:hypothetical protein
MRNTILTFLFLLFVCNLFAQDDTTTRISLSTWQQSSKIEPYGDLIRLNAEHGSAKGGIKFFRRGSPARVLTKAAPFSISPGQTLKLKINNGNTVTVTFDNITAGAATADQVSDAICKQVNFSSYPDGERDHLQTCQAFAETRQSGTDVPGDDVYVAIESTYYGAQSSIEVTGGTARTALGLAMGKTAGSNGTIDCGDDGLLDQRAWIICHDHPNNLGSNNRHKHISIEAADANGDMQTRFSISHGKDVSEILISSAMLIVDSYPMTIASSPNSYKDLDFSRGNTGQQINRVGQIRVDSDNNGGNMHFRVYDDEGFGTTLLSLNREDKVVEANAAIQTKIKSTKNTAQSVLTLTPSNGNVFVVSGTSKIQYISTTNWQPGSEITVILDCDITLVNEASSPTSTAKILHLKDSESFTCGSKGSVHKFVYDGPNYTNSWYEVSRMEY